METKVKPTTIVAKVSESKKTMLVGHRNSKYVIGYSFAWCANPDGKVKGDSLDDFRPRGMEPIMKEDGSAITHEDGSSVMRWVF